MMLPSLMRHHQCTPFLLLCSTTDSIPGWYEGQYEEVKPEPPKPLVPMALLRLCWRGCVTVQLLMSACRLRVRRLTAKTRRTMMPAGRARRQ